MSGATPCTETGELVGNSDYLATFCTEYSNREGNAVYKKADGAVVHDGFPAAAIGYTYGGALDSRGYYEAYSSARAGTTLFRYTFSNVLDLNTQIVSNTRHMLSDGCSIFAATVDGQLIRYDLGGNGTSPAIFHTGTSPMRIALDAEYLYWADQNYIGRIAR